MSGDPLSIESTIEVVSRRTDQEVAELVREAVSTSGRQVDDEVEEAAVSYDDLVSQITSEECMWIARTYGLYEMSPHIWRGRTLPQPVI